MANHKTKQLNIFDKINKLMFTHSKQIFMFLSAVTLMVVIYVAYHLWVIKREQSAQYDFSALVAEYDLMAVEKNPEWLPLLDKFKKTYEKHSRSSLSTYYQGYAVNILLKMGSKDAALAMLDTMIIDMQSSPIVALYEMKKALIKLDSADAAINIEGLEALKNLAQDTNNIFRDSAQFYLGRYYWATNQIELARNVWQQLVDEQRDEKIAASPWANQVQELLKITIS